MKRPWILASSGLVLTVTAGGIAQTPELLRGLDSFRVETVEVVGTRYVEPAEIAAATGLRRGANIFDDPQRWRDGVLSLPLVREVEFERKLPATIVITVDEEVPVALAAATELRPLDAAGRFLPLDPSGRAMDLPVLWPSEAPAATRLTERDRAVVETLSKVQGLDPALAARISELSAVPDGVRLRFRDLPRAEALVPVGLDGAGLARLRAAMSDVRARGELERVRRIDLRYREQLVVSFDSGSTG